MSTETRGHDPHIVPVVIEVTVNRRTVPITADRSRTVPAILVKCAAIAVGVAIQETFQLSVREHGRYQVLADDTIVELRHGLEFLAVAPDDNS